MTPPMRIRTGVKALIIHDHKILVVKERITQDSGESILYDLPGGGIEAGESLAEALHREVFEEVGLNVEIERPIGGWGFMVQRNGEQVHIVCLGYHCRVVGSIEIDTTKNPAKEFIFETMWLTKAEFMAEAEKFDSQDLVTTVKNIDF